MGKKRIFSEEEIGEICRLYDEEKIGIRKIGKKFKAGDELIKETLVKNNVELWKYNKEIDKQEICRLYSKDGLTCKEISEIIGIYEVKISQIIKESGLNLTNHARYFSESDKIEVCRLYDSEGLTIERISKIFGSTNKPIVRILKTYGIELRVPYIFTKEDKNKIKNLYKNEKAPLVEIAKEFKCCTKKIISILKELNVYEKKYIPPKTLSGREGYKYCSRCKEEKELSNFGQDKRSSDGLRGACSKCRKDESKKDYLKNKKKRKERHHRYYNENKGHLLNYSKGWYEENKKGVNKNRTKRRYSPAPFNTYGPQLTVEESPIEDEDGLLMCLCNKCKKYFYPNLTSVIQRITSLKGQQPGESRLYCSNNCKQGCSLYHAKSKSPLYLGNKPSQTELDIWRKQVLQNQLDEFGINFCEICNSKKDLRSHHIEPQKLMPEYALDPINGMILCKICHSKYGHSEECSTGALANKICI